MPDPDRRVYFLLQQAAHRLRVAADRECLAAAGVTTAQLVALHIAAERPACTQRQLAETLGLRESAVTAMIGRLVDAGLVLKGAHPTEHRAVALHVTDDGRAALAAAAPRMDAFNRGVRETLGPQLDDFAAGLLRLIERTSPSFRTSSK